MPGGADNAQLPLEVHRQCSVHFAETDQQTGVVADKWPAQRLISGLQTTGMDAMNDPQTPSRRRLLSAVFTGIFAATTWVAAGTAWALVCGLSQPACLALLLSASVGILLASWINVRQRPFPALVGLGSAATILCFQTRLLDLLLSLSAKTSWSALPAFAVSGLVPIALAFLTMQQIRQLVIGSSERPSVSAVLTGIAAGCAMMLVHGAVNLPLFVLPLASAVVLAVLRLTGRSADLPASPADPPPQPAGTPWTVWVECAAAGLLLAAVVDLMGNFFPLSADVLSAGVGMAAIGLLLLRRFALKLITKPLVAPIAVFVVAGAPYITDSLVEWNLAFNASRFGWGTIAGRASLLGIFVLLSLLPVAGLGRHLSWQQCVRGWGILLAAATGSLVLLPFATWIPVALAAVSLGIVRMRPMETAGPRGLSWPAILAASSACVLSLAGPADLTSSAGVLFSGRSVAGYRSGFDVDLIRQSDSRRLLASATTANGRIGFWRTIGDQLEIRRNGFPLSYVSTNVHTSPQAAADALATVIPLVLHPSPSRVVLIGDEAAVGLHTCTNFPLLDITALRSDVQTTSAVRAQVWQHAARNPFDDERVRVQHEAVSVSLRRVPASSIDVIVADHGGANRPAAQFQYSQEFYRLIRTRLSGDGIFCQRLPRYDLGSQPVLQLVAAACRAFDRVAMIRLDAGELALLAGGPDLIQGGLFERLQKPQVQQQLSRCGWDWSQLAALPIVDTADPFGLLEHVELPFAPSAANGYFAFRMTSETLRPADKNAEIRVAFAPHQRRLADVLPRSPGYQEFARRYAAVIQQNEILAAFPDQPWPYRKSLRSEMQRNPRPPLEVVRENRVTKVTHPADEHRKSYFVTLGEAIQQARDGFVHPRTLRELTQFTVRYEPLLSYFAHHELVRIHEHTGHPSPALELRHRLHSVYFTNADDLSVRVIAEAMEQLVKDPELLPTAELRYDHLNSMLQELVRRWDARRGHAPRSARQTQHDVEQCIRVANEALDALEEWSGSMDIAADDLRLRRKFVNRSLIAPLRDYQEQVVQHRLAHDVPVETAATDDELPILSSQPDPLATN